MKNIVISVALGAGAIFASSAADAAPVTKGLAITASKMFDWSATNLAAATALVAVDA